MSVWSPRRLLVSIFCMKRIALLLILGFALAQTATQYPNELAGYRFYQTAKWRRLRLGSSTISDVRKLLGSPDNATDLANAVDPYPGDEHVTDAVFTYLRLMHGWKMLIYLRNSCGLGSERPRLCSVDLMPCKRIPFANTKIPNTFAKRHVIAVDAAWDEYADRSGMRYEVYSTKTPYGNHIPGDLNRISYGTP